MVSIKKFFCSATYWEPLETEIGEYSKYLRGNVLNAGAGSRDISHLIEGTLFNQDLPHGTHNKNISIYSPLDKIPVENDFFNAIVCNAVLEHVENPAEVMREFYRVLKPGGYMYVAVPFMQPEHLDPTDFQRYTSDGLKKIIEDHKFKIIKIEGMLNVYHTIGWIAEKWLLSKKTFIYLTLRVLLFPFLKYRCKKSKTFVHSIASAYRVLAQKE